MRLLHALKGGVRHRDEFFIIFKIGCEIKIHGSPAFMGCPVGLPSIGPAEFIDALIRQTLDEIETIADVSRETIVICGSRSRLNVPRETM
jgi:hypothetical protein